MFRTREVENAEQEEEGDKSVITNSSNSESLSSDSPLYSTGWK
jgi:hypothetical protein